MSVINTVLRDLDRRGVARPEGLGGVAGLPGNPAPTSPGHVAVVLPRHVPWHLLLGSAVLGGCLMGGFMLLRANADAVWLRGTFPVGTQMRRALADDAPAQAAAPVGLVAPAPVPQPIPHEQAAAVWADTVRRAPLPDTFRLDLELRHVPTLSTTKPLASTATAAVSTTTPATRTVPATVQRAASTVAPVRASDGAQEALATAQQLWAAGAHGVAMDTLQEALRRLLGQPDADGGGALGSLRMRMVRELARMQLAQGHVQASMDTLTTVQRGAEGDAEWWALRGNASQRLALHAQAVESYQNALRLRPGELRWKLALTVSLAALGNVDAAAQWADQIAREGALSADVAAYLRQAGVPVPAH